MTNKFIGDITIQELNVIFEKAVQEAFQKGFDEGVGSVKRMVDYFKVDEPVKSANEQRYKLIQDAKHYWESNAGDKFEFKTNEEERLVFVWKVEREGDGFVTATGLSACLPGEVFNEDIQKAIALSVALEIPVPTKFANAVQPTETVLGMVVHYRNSIKKVSDIYVFGITSRLGSDSSKYGTIINDTNAEYSYE